MAMGHVVTPGVGRGLCWRRNAGHGPRFMCALVRVEAPADRRGHVEDGDGTLKPGCLGGNKRPWCPLSPQLPTGREAPEPSRALPTHGSRCGDQAPGGSHECPADQHLWKHPPSLELVPGTVNARPTWSETQRWWSQQTQLAATWGRGGDGQQWPPDSHTCSPSPASSEQPCSPHASSQG